MTDVLTARECSIVALLSRGFSLEDVGQQLGLSVQSMRTYKSRIQDKLGMPDVTGIRLWASPITDAELRRLTGQARAQVEELAGGVIFVVVLTGIGLELTLFFCTQSICQELRAYTGRALREEIYAKVKAYAQNNDRVGIRDVLRIIEGAQ